VPAGHCRHPSEGHRFHELLGGSYCVLPPHHCALVAGFLSFVTARKGRSRNARISSRAAPDLDFVAAIDEPDLNYVPIIVELPDGEQYQIEVRPIDNVGVIKVVLAMEMSWDEDFVEVMQDGNILQHEAVLKDLGLQEGSFFKIEYAEEEANEAKDAKESAPEGYVRITAAVEVLGKVSKHTCDVPEDALTEDVKKQVHAELAKKKVVLREALTADKVYLFQLKGGSMGRDGIVRQKFYRDERCDDDKTIKENGIDGNRELWIISKNLYIQCEYGREDDYSWFGSEANRR